MSQVPDHILYDVRLVERHIRQGILTRKELDARRKASVDMEGQADRLLIEEMGKKESPGKTAEDSPEASA